MALTAARGLPCGLNRGEEEADERADDGDDDEELDEGKPCTTGTGHGHGQTFREGVIRSDRRGERDETAINEMRRSDGDHRPDSSNVGSVFGLASTFVVSPEVEASA